MSSLCFQAQEGTTVRTDSLWAAVPLVCLHQKQLHHEGCRQHSCFVKYKGDQSSRRPFPLGCRDSNNKPTFCLHIWPPLCIAIAHAKEELPGQEIWTLRERHGVFLVLASYCIENNYKIPVVLPVITDGRNLAPHS